MQKIDLKAILEPRNRGILLDLVVFIISLVLMHVLTVQSLNIVRQAEENNSAKLVVGLFFAGVFLLQPLGPILKRWSFHERFKFETNSTAGCLLIGFMWFYLVLMILLSGTATIILSEVIFERGSPASEFGALFVVGGAVMSFVNAFLIYRYFTKPKKPPKWNFLTTPKSALLGDVLMFLNVICLQILWGGVSSSALFWSVLDSTPLGGQTGTISEILGRLIAISVLALLVYFPARIFYLAEDRNRKVTWLTMLLANLPLILRAFSASRH
ncbi:MAG TPA: hypothetical protein VEW46_21615 [Pyrinomonadaceae bacterium]|nr:hypothetical protein [Pyrinomonadaceae bacterium]